MDMTEMHTLAGKLTAIGIPFDLEPLWGGLHLTYPSRADTVCSVILHEFSYGHERGFLEIMGLHHNEDDGVEGWLTAEEVYTRICNHYYENHKAHLDLRYIDCPICGKQLVDLNIEDFLHDYWCDNCNIDIRVTEGD